MNKIVDKLKKTLYKLGYQINRIPKPTVFYKRIMTESQQIQIHELKKYFKLIKEQEDFKSYNRLLKMFVPTLNMNFSNTEFVGNGASLNSINTYRKIKLDNVQLFEKIYYSKSLTLKKINWLKEHVFPLLDNQILAPSIEETFEADLLTIVYFKYVDSKPIDIITEEQVMINISKYFYQLTNKIPIGDSSDYLFDYHKHGKYNTWENVAKKRAKTKNLNLVTIEKELIKAQRIFTHGDLKSVHVYEDGTIIDWDEAGFYPVGFEQAYIAHRCIINNKMNRVNPISWLNSNFSEIKEEMGDVFEFSFCYFLLIFLQIEFQKNKFLQFEKYLIEQLKKRLN